MTQAATDPAALTPVRRASGWAVALRPGGGVTAPITVTLASDRRPRAAYYQLLTPIDQGQRAVGVVDLGPAVIHVRDEWTAAAGDVRIVRRVEVQGRADDAFTSGLWIAADVATGWPDAQVFAPGVAYGDAGPVPAGTLGGRPARTAGVRTVLVREDRLTAPVFSIRGPDGHWVALLHESPDAATVAADGVVADGGDDLVDDRLRFASLGGRLVPDAGAEHLVLGACFPGTEGEYTYSSAGLPLGQPRRWRPRYHPLDDGLVQEYTIRIRRGVKAAATDWMGDVWRWAWASFRPAATPVDLDAVARDTTRVLVEQVVRSPAGAGVPLEVDAVNPVRTTEGGDAVMGFVGANTDVGQLLLREAERPGADSDQYRRLGREILDAFTRIPLTPPAAEGFDAFTGAPATYRSYRGRRAVYTRSLAEGALAVLQAAQYEHERGEEHDAWWRWVVAAGDWLAAAQSGDGALPRAWAAGTGEILDGSTTAGYVAVPFLVALSAATRTSRYWDVAVAAADHTWRTSGSQGSYAGATLDNPDVVDKEAAILSAEGFLDVYEASGEQHWLERAIAAASIAETWIYVWNVPMPVDADDTALHWKRGVPTAGHQLIASGVSMADGFLAVNAAAFVRLYRHTGDRHWLAVARLVTHGSTSMLARPGRTFDLRGPGWQQEHWCFAARRGFGLNRRWLPWVAVAHVRGLHRLLDLGPELARLVLDERWDGSRTRGEA